VNEIVNVSVELVEFCQLIVALVLTACAWVMSVQVFAVNVLNVNFRVPVPPVAVDGEHRVRLIFAATVGFTGKPFRPGLTVARPAWVVSVGPVQVCTAVAALAGELTPTKAVDNIPMSVNVRIIRTAFSRRRLRAPPQDDDNCALPAPPADKAAKSRDSTLGLIQLAERERVRDCRE
jgi:hypothetical protein